MFVFSGVLGIPFAVNALLMGEQRNTEPSVYHLKRQTHSKKATCYESLLNSLLEQFFHSSLNTSINITHEEKLMIFAQVI